MNLAPPSIAKSALGTMRAFSRRSTMASDTILLSQPKSRVQSAIHRLGSNAQENSFVPRFTYTKAELAEYRDVFCMFDKDRSGAIGYDEMEQAMKSLGMEAQQKDIEALIREVDIDGNGEIDFDEFCTVMKKLTQKKDSEDEVTRECFKVFDQDQDGIISEKEFHWVFREIGGFDEHEIDQIFSDTDVAGNGRLDYHEFAALVKNYLFDDE